MEISFPLLSSPHPPPPLFAALTDEAHHLSVDVRPQLSTPDPVPAIPPATPDAVTATPGSTGWTSPSLSEPSEAKEEEEEGEREESIDTKEDKEEKDPEGEDLKEDELEEEEEGLKLSLKTDQRYAESVSNDSEDQLNAEQKYSPTYTPSSSDVSEEEEKEEEEEEKEEEEVHKHEMGAVEDKLSSKDHPVCEGEAGEKRLGGERDSASLERQEGGGNKVGQEEGPPTPTSSSQDLSESDDFWGGGSPEHSTAMTVHGDNSDKEEREGDPSPSEQEDNSPAVVCSLLQSINHRLRSDREEAKYLYSDPSPTDDMKAMIVKSKVVNSLLTR